MSTLRKKYPLRRLKIIKKSISNIARPMLVVLALILLTSFILFSASELPLRELIGIRRTTLAFTLLVLAGSLYLAVYPLYQILYYKLYFYDIDEENLTIRKGVFSKREVNLPFSRIVDVYIDQDFVDMIFGLYNLKFSTATAESGKFAHIDGVSKKSAEAMKEIILDEINDIDDESDSDEKRSYS